MAHRVLILRRRVVVRRDVYRKLDRLMKRCVTTIAVLTVIDPLRVVATALVLRRLRKVAPESFDGHLAAAVVDTIIKEMQ